MKNSKNYVKKIQQLRRALSRKYPKLQKVVYDEPLDAIIYAIISAELREKATESAIKKFSDYFVNMNELRVSRTEEIVEILGEDTPVTRAIASTITTVLRAVFGQYHKVSLQALKKVGKRPARQILEKLDGTDRFVVDYCMLTSLQGHAIPLTKSMVEYLKSKELVYPEADAQQIAGFLAKQIPAKNDYDFYALLRKESETHKTKKKKKTKTTNKKSTKTKTKKKTKKVKKKKKVKKRNAKHA